MENYENVLRKEKKPEFVFDPSKDIASFYQYLFRLIPIKPNIILHSGRTVAAQNPHFLECETLQD